MGADFAQVVEELRKQLGANACPVILPWGREDQLLGQLDVINERAYRFSKTAWASFTVEALSAEFREKVVRARADLVSRVADGDDEVAELCMANHVVSAEVLKAAIRRATIANRFVPIVGGSAYQFVGVQPLLDAVVDYLPSPADVRSVSAHIDGAESSINVTSEVPVAALVFKVVHDEQGRRMVFLRTYAGVLKKGDHILNARTGRITRI